MKKFWALFLVVLSSHALAAGGSGTNVNTLFTTILSTLQGLGVVVVTIAIVWAGYKTLFKGVSIQEVGGPLAGAILIGAAPWLADLILN